MDPPNAAKAGMHNEPPTGFSMAVNDP
jgi:hypothetical protein